MCESPKINGINPMRCSVFALFDVGPKDSSLCHTTTATNTILESRNYVPLRKKVRPSIPTLKNDGYNGHAFVPSDILTLLMAVALSSMLSLFSVSGGEGGLYEG